jgi:hypothetical protein
VDSLVDIAKVIDTIVVLPLMVVAITVCFQKGRRGTGWIGIAVLVLSFAGSFPLFRLLRDRDAEGWLVLVSLFGVIILLLIGRQVWKPALPGSRWARRHERTTPVVH